MKREDFERSIMGGGIPMEEAAGFFHRIKTAGWTDPPDETGMLEGQFVAPVEQVVAKVGEVVAAKFRKAVAYYIYAQSMRGLAQQSIADEFMEHACQEQCAAEAYLKRAAVLGGGPVHVPEIETPPASAQPLDILMRMARAEQEGIAAQRELRAMVGEENPFRAQIDQFMVEDQYHLDELWQLMPSDAHVGGDVIPAEGEEVPLEGGEELPPGEEAPSEEVPEEEEPTEELPPAAEEAPPEEAPPEEAPIEEKAAAAGKALMSLRRAAETGGRAAAGAAQEAGKKIPAAQAGRNWSNFGRAFRETSRDAARKARSGGAAEYLGAAGAGAGLTGALASRSADDRTDKDVRQGLKGGPISRFAARNPGTFGAGIGAVQGASIAAMFKRNNPNYSLVAPGAVIGASLLDAGLKSREKKQAKLERKKEAAPKGLLVSAKKGLERYGELVTGSKAREYARKSQKHLIRGEDTAARGLQTVRGIGAEGSKAREEARQRLGPGFARKFERHMTASRLAGDKAMSEGKKVDRTRLGTGLGVAAVGGLSSIGSEKKNQQRADNLSAKMKKASSDEELKDKGRERAVVNMAAEGHRDRLRRGERFGSLAGSAAGALGGAALGKTPVTRAAGGALGYLVGSKAGKTVGEEVDLRKNAEARFDEALRKLGYYPGQEAATGPDETATPDSQLGPAGESSPQGMGTQPMMANPPGSQRFDPVNYLEAEQVARQAQEQNEAGFYRERAHAAEAQNQSMGQMVQAIQEQLNQVQAQAAESGSQIMQATQEASAAHDSALQQATLAARMRMGMQALRAQMMEIASQDPEQLAAAAGGPSPSEVGDVMAEGDAANMGQQQTMDPSGQAEPGAQPGTPGAAPAQGSQPGTPPPGAGAPGPAPETQNASGEAGQNADETAELQSRKEGSAVRQAIRQNAPWMAGGALVGAVQGVREGGKVDAMRAKVEELQGKQDGGFARALEIAHAQMDLANAEKAKHSPGVAALKGGVRGAGMGMAIGSLLRSGKHEIARAGKNIQDYRSI